MDEQSLRQRAEAHCEALLAGDIDRAAEDLSKELRAHLGQFVAQLPLPLTEATIERVEIGSSHVVTLHLVSEEGDIRLATRWKERDGRPTIVEASNVVTQPAVTAEDAGEETE